MSADSLNIFFLTKIASTEGFFVVAILVALYQFFRKEWHRARTFLFTAVGLAVSTTLIKLLIAAPRPDGALVEVTGYGFPSGHASGSMFVALTACVLALRLPRRYRYLAYAGAILFTVTIGTSRIYLSVHTPLQVFAGYALGAFWALTWFWLTRRVR